MFISLYSTRLILDALGVSDYGIFNLVAGVIAMLSFLNSAMTVSTQRYMSFHLGAGEFNKLNEVFRSSVILHLIIGICIVIFLEVAGLFLFNGILNMPNNRIGTAKIIYHFMVVSTFFTINAVPYDAILNSHENMLFESIVGIVESVFKLIIAVWIIYSKEDKLILFGLLTAGLTILIRIIKSRYCSNKYAECKFTLNKRVNFNLLKEMLFFAGWNLFGALCSLGKTQGLAIVFNIFLGPIINAAYGIANQVSGQLSTFSQIMLQAINPQIMKSEGANERQRMMRLSMTASKFGFFLLAFIAIPCIYEMPFLLKFWLKEVPNYTIQFCSWVLIAMMINQMTAGLDSAIQASGNIKLYMLIVGTLKLLIVPLGYLMMKIGFPVIYVIIGYAAIETIAGIARMIILKIKLKLSIRKYLKYLTTGMLFPIIATNFYLFIITTYLNFDYRFLFTISSSVVVFFISIYFGGLNNEEKLFIKSFYLRIYNRIL